MTKAKPRSPQSFAPWPVFLFGSRHGRGLPIRRTCHTWASAESGTGAPGAVAQWAAAPQVTQLCPCPTSSCRRPPWSEPWAARALLR